MTMDDYSYVLKNVPIGFVPIGLTRLNLSPAAVSRLAQRGRRDPLSETIGKALFGKEGE
jgi:hypothetical protein